MAEHIDAMLDPLAAATKLLVCSRGHSAKYQCVKMKLMLMVVAACAVCFVLDLVTMLLLLLDS